MRFIMSTMIPTHRISDHAESGIFLPTKRHLRPYHTASLFEGVPFCCNLSKFNSHPFRYSFGLIPLRREKNLLKDGVSAKWRWSAIWLRLSWEVCNRKEASISSI